jgi:hypothetical protein
MQVLYFKEDEQYISTHFSARPFVLLADAEAEIEKAHDEYALMVHQLNNAKTTEVRAAYDKGVLAGCAESKALEQSEMSRAVQREREEIVAQLERLDCPTAAQIVRAGKPATPEEIWELGLSRSSDDKKPAKIARLAVKGSASDWDIDTLTLTMKLNELIDRENARG